MPTAGQQRPLDHACHGVTPESGGLNRRKVLGTLKQAASESRSRVLAKALQLRVSDDQQRVLAYRRCAQPAKANPAAGSATLCIRTAVTDAACRWLASAISPARLMAASASSPLKASATACSSRSPSGNW